MKKTFWITLGLFVLSLIIFIVKRDVVNEGSLVFNFAFFFVFIFLVFMNFPLIGVILIPLIIWIVVLLVKNIESEILKMVALSFFMLFTAINLIEAASLLGQ